MGMGGAPTLSVSMPSKNDIILSCTHNFEMRTSDICFTIKEQGWIIKGIIMNNEKLFKDTNGNHVAMQSISTNSITVPIKQEKNTKQSIETKIIVGQGLDSASFHTIDMGAVELKKFQMFQLNGDQSLRADQNSYVTGTIEDKMVDAE